MHVRLLPQLKTMLQVTAALLFFILLALSLNNWYKWRALHSIPTSCDAVINIHKDRQQLSVRVRYSFLDNEGSATLSGILMKDSETIAQVSRKIFFSYTHVNEGINLKNKKTVISHQDTVNNEGLKKILPAFYMKAGERTSFLLYPQKPGGYVFVKDFIPAFYCAEQ